MSSDSPSAPIQPREPLGKNPWRARARWTIVFLATLAVTTWMLTGALRTRSDRTFEAALSPGDFGDLTQARDLFDGWIPQPFPQEEMVSVQQPVHGIPRYALALPAGGVGRLGYCLFLEPGEQARVTVRARNDQTVQITLGLKNNLDKQFDLEFPKSENAGAWVEQTLDLTPYLSEAQGFLFWIYAKNTGTNSPEPLLTVDRVSFQFTQTQTPQLAVGSALFFSAVCFLAWFLLFGIFLPVLWNNLRLLWRALHTRDFWSRHFWWKPALLLLGLIFAGGVLTHPLWYGPKRHDDLWALGNTRLLAQKRFDTRDLFFRSRVRPGFLALALPLQAGLAHTLVSVSTTPSDFYQRVFFVYERTGWSWGTRFYPEATFLGLLTAFSALTLMVRMAGLWSGSNPDRSTLRAAWCGILGLWFFWRVLESPTVNIITLSATWAFCVAPLYLFCGAWHTRDARFLFGSGVATGIAILFNESALTVVAPLVCFQGFLLFENRDRGKMALQFAGFWLAAGVLPLLYYGCLIEGRFGEISRNFGEFAPSQNILKGTGFEERGLTGTARGLWSVFGPGLLLAIAGLVLELKRVIGKCVSESDRRAFCFYLFWAMGCLPVFGLPYFYPRFLVYLIPAGAWFASVGLEALYARFFKRSNEGPPPDTPESSGTSNA